MKAVECVSVEESIRMTEDRDKWRKYVTSMVWPILGSRTAKEQNRTCIINKLVYIG